MLRRLSSSSSSLRRRSSGRSSLLGVGRVRHRSQNFSGPERPRHRFLSSARPQEEYIRPSELNHHHRRHEVIIPPPLPSVQSPPLQRLNVWKPPIVNGSEQENSIDSKAVKTLQPAELSYTEGQAVPITSTFELVTPDQDPPRGIWPAFRVMVRTTVDI